MSLELFARSDGLSARQRTPPQVAPWSRVPASRWAFVAHHNLSSSKLTCRHHTTGTLTGGVSFGRGAAGHIEVVRAISTSYGRDTPAPYKWSWQDDTEPAVPLELEASLLTAADSVQDLAAALRAAISAAPARATLTNVSRRLLASSFQQLLLRGPTAEGPVKCSVADVARLLEAYCAACQGTVVDPGAATPMADISPRLVTWALAHICALPAEEAGTSGQPSAPAAVLSVPAHDLADLLWALSELEDPEVPWEQGARHVSAIPPPPAAAAAAAANPATIEAVVAAEAPGVLQRAVLARVRNQDFLAPDLCRVVCALGSLGAAPASGAQRAASSSSMGEGQSTGALSARGGSGFVVDCELIRALNEETRYQLTEFDADFEAEDLARLISGMAGLRLGAAVASDEEYRRILMKAVYGKTRSIADKASVDFALSRLLADDPEARSMHYDSRWTHEELRWLPRRERDKRRILKEGWYRTKWGGWSPGGDAGS